MLCQTYHLVFQVLWRKKFCDNVIGVIPSNDDPMADNNPNSNTDNELKSMYKKIYLCNENYNFNEKEVDKIVKKKVF